MTIATIPTRNPSDLGAALYDARTPNANELAAVNIEKIKDRLIEVVTEVGLSNGATAGSINEMRTAFTAGAYSSILRRIGSAYGAQRLGGGVGAPTVADDSGEGYAPGSWWVQVFGPDNLSTLAFWLCIDATEGAAVWVQIKSSVIASDADPLAPGVADPGTSDEYARADHVHPRSRAALPVDFDASMVFQSYAGNPNYAYTSFSGALVPSATPWTIAMRMLPSQVGGYGFTGNGFLIAKWNYGTGASSWALGRYGNGLVLYLGDGTTNTHIGIVYTLDTIFDTVEREIALVWDGTEAAWANRVKIFTRTVGGTWINHTLTFTVQPPTTLPVPSEQVTIAVRRGETYQAPSFTLRDVRIWGAAVIPSGTSDMTLTGLTSRWRFRSLTTDRMSSPDEVGGALMTLTNVIGGRRRPTRIANAWNPGTPSGPKVLVIGDSKSADSFDRPSSWRYECANQIAAAFGVSIDYVGRYTDTFADPAFASNAQHSALSGDLLSGGILTRCTDDVATYTPDVVVIEGATNDAFAGASATTIRDRMSACIDAVLAASATARVVVCSDPTIRTTANPTEGAVLAAYNALLPALVASKPARVSFCDLYPLNHDADFVDNLHLNAIGCQRLGEELAIAIAAAL